MCCSSIITTGLFSPDRLLQTPLQSYGYHKEAFGPEPSQPDQSPAAEAMIS